VNGRYSEALANEKSAKITYDNIIEAINTLEDRLAELIEPCFVVTDRKSRKFSYIDFSSESSHLECPHNNDDKIKKTFDEIDAKRVEEAKILPELAKWSGKKEGEA